MARDRRRLLLLGGLALSALHVLAVGGDMFRYSRFLAPWVPLVLALALSVGRRERRGGALWVLPGAAACLAVIAQVGVLDPRSLENPNGRPDRSVPAAVLIRDNTAPDARVAVFAAGCLPYFSRRPCLDLLGRANAEVARQAPRSAVGIGHRKFDHDASLAARPDLVVTLMPHARVLAASEGRPEEARGYFVALARNALFREQYLPHPVPLPFLLEQSAIYLHRASRERATMDDWPEASSAP